MHRAAANGSCQWPGGSPHFAINGDEILLFRNFASSFASSFATRTAMIWKPFTFAALFSAAAVADPAPESHDSPTDVSYRATFTKGVDGYVNFSSKNGSVIVDVDISGLPNYGGPFMYHIHEKQVPSDGNCTGTKAHFNPYHGYEKAPTPAELEVGDLSGRHGEIHAQSFQTSYIDPYLSLNPDNKAFFANLSVVVHLHNTSRIACANITKEYTVPPVEGGASGKTLAAGAVALAAGALLI
ncbi:hypothetical protein CA7LBN_002819 [Candidozyma auris]|uniref:superoxide dismutase n=2 Tax=Candidozyma auris TaxID=498019 RepID=A0A8F3AHA6_CANAR|nr:hypothetical protein CA7LBN_002819 [[Candida] auris]